MIPQPPDADPYHNYNSLLAAAAQQDEIPNPVEPILVRSSRQRRAALQASKTSKVKRRSYDVNNPYLGVPLLHERIEDLEGARIKREALPQLNVSISGKAESEALKAELNKTEYI